MPNMLSQGLLWSATREAVCTWTTASTDAAAAWTNASPPAVAATGAGQLGAAEEGVEVSWTGVDSRAEDPRETSIKVVATPKENKVAPPTSRKNNGDFMVLCMCHKRTQAPREVCPAKCQEI